MAAAAGATDVVVGAREEPAAEQQQQQQQPEQVTLILMDLDQYAGDWRTLRTLLQTLWAGKHTRVVGFCGHLYQGPGSEGSAEAPTPGTEMSLVRLGPDGRRGDVSACMFWAMCAAVRDYRAQESVAQPRRRRIRVFVLSRADMLRSLFAVGRSEAFTREWAGALGRLHESGDDDDVAVSVVCSTTDLVQLV